MTNWTGPFTREEFLERATEHERAAQIGLAVGPNINYVRTFQACADALRIAASVKNEKLARDPKKIELNARMASTRNIHLAIELLHRGEFEAALALASAGEGVLAEPDKPYLRTKQKAAVAAMPKDEEAALDINDAISWVKHGTVKGVHAEKVITTDIEFEVINMIGRAISKFVAVYDGQTERMKEFNDWATKRLPDDRKSKQDRQTNEA